MSKKVRGPVRQRRPGARPTTQRGAAARVAQPSQLEAAEIIAEDVSRITGRRGGAGARGSRANGPHAPGARTKPGSLLAAKAATEYVYVAQDMRRILLVAAALFGTLFALWLLIVQLHIIPLPFY